MTITANDRQSILKKRMQDFVHAFNDTQDNPASLSQSITVLIENSGGDAQYLMWQICYLLRHLRLNKDNATEANALCFFMVYLHDFCGIKPEECRYYGKTGAQLLIKGAEHGYLEDGPLSIDVRTSAMEKNILALYARVVPEIGNNWVLNAKIGFMGLMFGLLVGFGVGMVLTALLLPATLPIVVAFSAWLVAGCLGAIPGALIGGLLIDKCVLPFVDAFYQAQAKQSADHFIQEHYAHCFPKVAASIADLKPTALQILSPKVSPEANLKHPLEVIKNIKEIEPNSLKTRFDLYAHFRSLPKVSLKTSADENAKAQVEKLEELQKNLTTMVKLASDNQADEPVRIKDAATAYCDYFETLLPSPSR